MNGWLPSGIPSVHPDIAVYCPYRVYTEEECHSSGREVGVCIPHDSRLRAQSRRNRKACRGLITGI